MRPPSKTLFGDDRGALTPLFLVLFIGIIVSTGIALDLIRQDSERSDLQDALDRGVLAAASLTQVVDAETTVTDFLESRSLSEAELVVSVNTDTALNYRQVTASAAYPMDTIFLRLVGLSSLAVTARSVAVQAAPDIEISLVLDISGSMARERTGGTSQSRLAVLRGAASGFIDTVLTDETRTKTSVSLIPYSGQVNAGSLFDILVSGRDHSNGSCVEFADADFDRTGLPGSNSRGQVPQFQWFRFEADYGFEAEWGWCPSDRQAILPFSNDPDALKAKISDFVAHDGTGTQNGLKYGLGLLDPVSQPITAALVSAGRVDPAFEPRPAPFNDPGALKVIVLMTDGNIRYQQRPKPEYSNNASARAQLMSNRLSSTKAILTSTPARNSDEAKRVTQFGQLCALAKQNGVTVFTIGFDIAVTSAAYTEMRNCASSPGHFYHVQGLDLAAAFQQIATTINKLKLVE